MPPSQKKSRMAEVITWKMAAPMKPPAFTVAVATPAASGGVMSRATERVSRRLEARKLMQKAATPKRTGPWGPPGGKKMASQNRPNPAPASSSGIRRLRKTRSESRPMQGAPMANPTTATEMKREATVRGMAYAWLR